MVSVDPRLRETLMNKASAAFEFYSKRKLHFVWQHMLWGEVMGQKQEEMLGGRGDFK